MNEGIKMIEIDKNVVAHVTYEIGNGYSINLI